MPYDTASDQWAAGLRRLETAPPDQRPVLERVTRQIQDELRRRLGGPFTTRELADLYSAGTDWCLDVAIATVPSDPRAWDAQTTADAAFARYVREASDWSGGRRREIEELEHQAQPLDQD